MAPSYVPWAPHSDLALVTVVFFAAAAFSGAFAADDAAVLVSVDAAVDDIADGAARF